MYKYKKIKYLITITIIGFFGFNFFFNEKAVKIKNQEKVEIKYDLKFRDIYLDKRQNYIYNKVALKRYQKQKFREVIFNGRSKESLNKKYYIILEGSKFYGTTKFCHNKYSPRLLEMYPNDPILQKAYLENEKIRSDNFDYFDTCVYNNCLFTCDESLLNVSDALIFLAKANSYPKRKRNQDQIYMLWNDEARGGGLENHYNWTITFKLDSEISYCSYGCYLHLDREQTHDPKTFEITKNINIRKEYSKRKNEALWFVSNCDSSFRLKYADKLSEYFPISFFGRCNSQLKSSKAKVISDSCPRNSDCEEDKLRSYKFYLAFENNNCSYYTTEKFWRSLEYNIIPVVIQPNKEYYTRIAPKDSFIHAQDFNYDYKLLAQYLEQVSNNFKLYKTYLEWTKKFKPLYDAKPVEQMRMCELCYKLNTESSAIYYTSMDEFMNDGCDK